MSNTWRNRRDFMRSLQKLDHMGIGRGIRGSKTEGQVLDTDRYAGVNVYINDTGDWHVTPSITRTTVILVVRRVDQRTAVITDSKGEPYSELMRIPDAIALLQELT